MKKDHFWFTCVAQKRLCLSSLIPGCAQSLHPRELTFFFCVGWQIPGDGDYLPRWGGKKRANAPSSDNTATFFIDRTVEQCHFQHFNVQFFFSINVFLCINNARILTGTDYRFLILIKTSCRDDTCLWFQSCYKIIDIKINRALYRDYFMVGSLVRFLFTCCEESQTNE